MSYILVMNTLGERLAWARKQKNLSQDQLGEMAGSSGSAIGNIEAGTRHSSRKIAAIASVLDVDVLWLSEGKGTPDAHKKQLRLVEPSNRTNWARLAPFELSMVTTYRETDEIGRGIVEGAIEMAEKRVESVVLHKS